MSCTFTLLLDSTVTTVLLSDLENVGVAVGIIKIAEPSETATAEIYKNGKRMDYELGQELSEYADYQVFVTDIASNISEYSFTLKHLLNGVVVALIIGILAAIGAIIAVALLRKKR